MVSFPLKKIYSNETILKLAETLILGEWGAQMVIFQPIKFKGESIGILELYNAQEQRKVNEEEVRLWQAVTDQAAMAIINAKLYEGAQLEISERI